uniref:Secreted protein n=1 Tax=Ascaris lumbricoides TaxID=6252 RepID=A0A0M3IEU6_ASCLU
MLRSVKIVLLCWFVLINEVGVYEATEIRSSQIVEAKNSRMANGFFTIA